MVEMIIVVLKWQLEQSEDIKSSKKKNETKEYKSVV